MPWLNSSDDHLFLYSFPQNSPAVVCFFHMHTSLFSYNDSSAAFFFSCFVVVCSYVFHSSPPIGPLSLLCQQRNEKQQNNMAVVLHHQTNCVIHKINTHSCIFKTWQKAHLHNRKLLRANMCSAYKEKWCQKQIMVPSIHMLLWWGSILMIISIITTKRRKDRANNEEGIGAGIKWQPDIWVRNKQIDQD